MAKLNVEVLDMVDGEITKVAYDGAEYAKVDSVVESTEDILLAIEHGNDRTKGEFYRVIGVGSIIRWEDDVSTNGVSAEYIGERFAVFRKISAEPSPTLEERVTELESDVAVLKSSGSSLKGEKVETEKYSAIKEGDEVTINFAVWKKHGVLGDLTEGKRYKVIERRDGLNIIDDAGDERNLFVDEPEVVNVVKSLKYIPQVGDIVVVTGNTSGHSTVAIRTMPQDICKATPAEVEAYEKAAHKASFAVGDYVKLIKSERGNVGAIAKIIEVGEIDTQHVDGSITVEPFRLEHLTGKIAGETTAGPAEWIVKATDAEIAKATAPKLKAGDFVKIIDRDCYDLTNGKMYEIGIDSDGDAYIVVDDDGDTSYAILDEDVKYEIVDAETAKWAKIGRKVNEFKEGDIVRVTKSHNGHPVGTIGKLVPTPEYIGTDLGVLANGHKKSHIGGMELIAPVESTLN